MNPPIWFSGKTAGKAGWVVFGLGRIQKSAYIDSVAVLGFLFSDVLMMNKLKLSLFSPFVSILKSKSRARAVRTDLVRGFSSFFFFFPLQGLKKS